MRVSRWRVMASALLACAVVLGGCGDDPQPTSNCTVQRNTDGTATIRCTDGTSVTLRGGLDGANGANGSNGTNGTAGMNGSSCSVAAADGGDRVVTCTDGTRVTVPAGRDGVACTVTTQMDSGVRTIRCNDGTSATVNNGRDGLNTLVRSFHGTRHLLSSGNYLNGNKRRVQATITAATATPEGRVTVDFRVEELDRRPVTDLASVSANIAKLQPQGRDQGSNRWVPYIYRQQVVTGTGSWPAPAGTSAWQASRENNGTFTNNRDGTYRYVFATNLTTATMGTTPIPYERNRTHRIVIMMGGRAGPTDDAHFDFVPDGTPLTERRDVVATATCQGCHGETQFAAHGGDRLSVEACGSCHVPGNVDPHGGESLDLAVMVHRIHAGRERSSIAGPDGVFFDNPATPANEAADNGRYAIWGNGNTQNNFDRGSFPAVLANCTACHRGSVPQVDNWRTRPTSAACGSCHDRVNFVTGANHGNAVSRPGPSVADSQCNTCHRPTEGIAPIVTAHAWTTRDPRNNPEFDVTLTMTPPANGRFYVSGEAPTVSVVLRDRVTAMPIDHNTVAEDPTAEGCLAPPGVCPPRDGLFRAALLFVHGPRARRMPVLTTAARSQVVGPTTGPYDLSAAGATLVLRFDSGQDLRGRDVSGGDVLRPGTVTVPVSGGTFARVAAATTDEVVTWLNGNAAFRARGVAWNEAGRVGVRSRNLGDVFGVQLTAGPVTTAVFGGDVAAHLPTGFTPGNTISRRTVASNNDPRVSWTSGAITYRLDPVDDLSPGTYVVSVEISDRGRIDGNNYLTPSVATLAFQVKSADAEPLIAGNCNSCHQNSMGQGLIIDPSRHNKLLTTNALDQCGACHDAQPQAATGAAWSGARPIGRRIHAIHNGANLNYPLATVDYGNGDPVPGRNWRITFPQDTRNCETTCHTPGTSGTWATLPARLPCSGCHDSEAAMSHMRLQTYDPTPADPWSGDEQESCGTCH
ncbi:MAG: OmcA/MtrC family decaheme c-type cytochrome [Deltaproteobacteria bacterium]|nr:OmcA/MtrC family decaheme c-type cytochrome [Deltaproteobacteria bacterium]